MPDAQSVFERWWPTTQSIDLIEGSLEVVADAAADEFGSVARYSGHTVTANRQAFDDLDGAFASVRFFDNVPTQLLLLPSHSPWIVVWSNSFLCDGFDRFCSGMTTNHSFTTVHWSAHDTTTTFQPGATFHLRRASGHGVIERRVQASRTDRRWDFFEIGDPIPEEDVAGYGARRKRDRLNERRVMELLDRLGARPWDEDWYALPERPVCSLERPLPPRAIRRTPEAVITGKGGLVVREES